MFKCTQLYYYGHDWTSDSPGRMAVFIQHTHTHTGEKALWTCERGTSCEQKLTDSDNGGSDRFLHHGT